MEPNYQTRQTGKGVLYRGNSFPLDQTLAHRARMGKVNSYSSIVSQHEKLKQKKRRTVYSELALLFSVIALLLGLLVLALHRSASHK